MQKSRGRYLQNCMEEELCWRTDPQPIADFPPAGKCAKKCRSVDSMNCSKVTSSLVSADQQLYCPVCRADWNLLTTWRPAPPTMQYISHRYTALAGQISFLHRILRLLQWFFDELNIVWFWRVAWRKKAATVANYIACCDPVSVDVQSWPLTITVDKSELVNTLLQLLRFADVRDNWENLFSYSSLRDEICRAS